jgi:hypothetical protein
VAPAATTTAAAEATPVAETAAEAAAAAIFAGLGFVDGESSAVDFMVVDAQDGGPRFVFVAHFHEAEALVALGVATAHDLHALHGPELGEQLLEFRIVRLMRQVADK